METKCEITVTHPGQEESAEARKLRAKGFRLAATDFSEAVRKRIFSVVKKDKLTGCWNYPHISRRTGYGKISIQWPGSDGVLRQKTIGAHRVAYAVHHGELPEGKYVCHKCDNPPCINPEHLFLGDSYINVRDKWDKGRGRVVHGEDCGASKLTEQDAIRIIELYPHHTQKAISRMFNVTKSTVKRLWLGQAWKHLKRPGLYLDKRSSEFRRSISA